MTQVQVNYWAHQENRRHNFATEAQAKAELAETVRHDKSVEGENKRHNIKVEGETKRHNLVTEGQGDRDLDIKEFAAREQQRTNKANETLRGKELKEKVRTDKANEKLRGGELKEKVRTDKANERLRGKELSESKRSHKANENLKSRQISEQERANKAQEQLKAQQLAQEYERIKSQIARNDVENALTEKKISRYDIEVLSKLGKAGQYTGLAELGVSQAAELADKADEFLKNTTYNKTTGEYTFKGSKNKPGWLSDMLSQLMKGMDAYDKRTGGIGKW